jgi:hypothetical protein
VPASSTSACAHSIERGGIDADAEVANTRAVARCLRRHYNELLLSNNWAATVTTLDILVKVELGYIIHVALHADWDARGCGTGDLRSVTNQVRVRSSRMWPLGSQK